MPDIRTCLWFDDNAEKAVTLYTTLVPDSGIDTVQRPAPDAPPILIHFHLGGTPYSALQAGPGQTHSAAASIAAVLPQAAADALYDGLLTAGGSEVQCGWVTDPFSISWQVIPDGFTARMFGGTAEENTRAFAAMQQMKRLDLGALEAAIANTTPA